MKLIEEEEVERKKRRLEAKVEQEKVMRIKQAELEVERLRKSGSITSPFIVYTQQESETEVAAFGDDDLMGITEQEVDK